MNKYVVDAWAWIEYFIGSEYGSKLNEILEDASTEVYTCAITLAEVISKTAREGRDVEAAYDLLLSNSQVINADEEVSKQAGLLHAKMRKTEKDFGQEFTKEFFMGRNKNSFCPHKRKQNCG